MPSKSLSVALLLAGASILSVSACGEMGDHTTSSETAIEAPTYQPTGWLAKSLPEIAAGVAAGEVNSEDLVNAYLERIKKVDRSGPNLRSIISLNANAVAEAKRLDELRAAGEIKGPLHGVPVLLKDNIESKDEMPTTAGALALKDNVTGRDSPLVAGLRAQGAVILGKTNLSQWANFRSNDSMSGWSALGGQVKNPHSLDRNPCGSSSGSGAAAAASLAAGTVGTETNGSVICPSNANGIVGFKPTVGLVAQDLIIPISSSQDTAGPMTKTVKGAAMMLNAMATGEAKTDYVAGLMPGFLKGKKIGVLTYARGGNQDIHIRFDAAIEVLRALGAEIIEIAERPERPSGFGRAARQVLYYEFKATLNEYLAGTPETVQTRSLADLIDFNEANADAELALFDQSIFKGAVDMDDLTAPEYIEARDMVQKATRQEGIDKLLADYDVEMLVAPSGPVVPRIDPANGDVWPSFPGAGSMAAIAGYPHGTVPMGTVHGLSVGLSFISAKDKDADVLAAMFAYEQATNLRAEPLYQESLNDRPEIAPALEGYLFK